MKTIAISFALVATVFASTMSIGSSAHAAKLSIATKGDQLVYDKAVLSAKAGQEVELTFKNASAKSSGLQHNWVLVKPGTADSVAQASIAAGADKGWLADSPDIIAHTKLVNAGESETVKFKAPADAGDYPYICSFPGHAVTMKGVLKIKK